MSYRTKNGFVTPIVSYDIHVYFDHTDEQEIAEAERLHEQVTNTFINPKDVADKLPTARIHQVHKRPLGPHPKGMFEIDFATPYEFGILVPWMQINHGNLSVLVHPRTGHVVREHTHNAIWIGEKVDLLVDFLQQFDK
jgi:DOPA 4,5-dioxygenase